MYEVLKSKDINELPDDFIIEYRELSTSEEPRDNFISMTQEQLDAELLLQQKKLDDFNIAKKAEDDAKKAQEQIEQDARDVEKAVKDQNKKDKKSAVEGIDLTVFSDKQTVELQKILDLILL